MGSNGAEKERARSGLVESWGGRLLLTRLKPRVTLGKQYEESERKTEVCMWVLCRGWSLQGKRAKGGSSIPCWCVSKGDGHGCT